jgi:hypothetical protein
VEDTPTILLMIEQESNAKTCASLVMRLEAGEARWAVASERSHFYPFAKLLRGFSARSDLVRSRIQVPEQQVIDIRTGAQPKLAVPHSARREMFEAETVWRSR